MRVYFNFSDLIGNKYDLETKMIVLNWMLKTGKGHEVKNGAWSVLGINKALLGYSANEHDVRFHLNLDSMDKYSEGFYLDTLFDSTFARAIYQKPNEAVKSWRKKERIKPNVKRYLNVNCNVTKGAYDVFHCLSWAIYKLHKFKGQFLEKEYAQPQYKDRINPKILCVEVFTIGSGWAVSYTFSFSNFDYESGWEVGFYQKGDESIWELFYRAYLGISKRIKP